MGVPQQAHLKGDCLFLKPQFRPPRNASRRGLQGRSRMATALIRSGLLPPYLGHNGLFYESLTRRPEHSPEQLLWTGSRRGDSAAFGWGILRVWGGFRRLEATMKNHIKT